MMPLSEPGADMAEARCRAYGLFSRLALDGCTKDTVDLIDTVPELAAAAEAWDVDGKLDLVSAAAVHYEVMIHEVFPYRSVFVAADGRPGGPQTEQVAAAYDRVGFRWDAGGPSADHVGLLLQALGFLCGAEADAWVDARTEVTRGARTLQVELLDEYLLPWWPALAEAVVYNANPFYRAWVDAVSALVFHHREELLADGFRAPTASPERAPSSEDAELVFDDDLGAVNLADRWLTASVSGALLTRGALKSLGRRARLPTGFGARRTVLMNLLRSGATYDGLDGLLGRLRDRFAQARRYYSTYQADAPPVVAGFVDPWTARCAATEAGLATLQDRARLT